MQLTRNTNGLQPLKPKKSGISPGRPKGIPNVATSKARARAQRLVEDKKYAANLRKRLIEGTLSPYMEATLWAYAYGKPKELHQHEITGVQRVIEVILSPPEKKELEGETVEPLAVIDVTPDKEKT